MSEEKASYVRKVQAMSSGKVVGEADVILIAEDEHGLRFLRSTLTLKDVRDLNRQRIQDTLNATRRVESNSLQARIKRACKLRPDLSEQFEALLSSMK